MKDTSLTSEALFAAWAEAGYPADFWDSREELLKDLVESADSTAKIKESVDCLSTAMAGMLSEAGYPADFDVSSLGRLDDLISRNTTDGRPNPGWFFAPPHRGPDASLDARSGALGMYLGEALRRRHGGQWRLARPGEPWQWGPVLQFPNGVTIDPIQAVVDRVLGGPAVSEYASAAAAFAEGRATGDEGGDVAA